MNFKKEIEKYKKTILDYLISMGVEFMFKGLWSWLKSFGKKKAIELIENEKTKAEFIELYEKYAGAEFLYTKVSAWLIEKINKI